MLLEDEKPLIRSSGRTIPCSGENIPCFNLQGIRVQDIEINTLLNVENRQTGQKNRKFPVIFSVLREFLAQRARI
jgi:hypothetical protein